MHIVNFSYIGCIGCAHISGRVGLLLYLPLASKVKFSGKKKFTN